jgi:AGCS family alanine or glycine:cation symporter
MDSVNHILAAISNIVWGPLMLVLLLGTGLFLMIGLRLFPLLKLGYGFRQLWLGRKKVGGQGEITPFNALMTALSATVGTGNIAGVATAIFLGGPGALFWMWITALIGMATKYSEAVCAVHFREVDNRGHYVGGPMYYIKNGLGKNWLWLAALFALFGGLASFGIGNTTQANSIADVLATSYAIPRWITAVVLMALVGLVVLGGLKSIANVAGKLVPFMAVFYLVAGFAVLVLNAAELPATFALIFKSAFTPVAAQGGFAGAAVWAAIRFGVARGIFSNEAGLGSAPIAHAAAVTSNPDKQGTVAMLGTFIDTIVVCSITGLVILSSGLWTSGVNGAPLSSQAFAAALPHVGEHVVTIGLALFAFTTILGWSYYGERCVQYLLGTRAIPVFRIIWVLAIPLGALAKLNLIWAIADILNGLMAIPNLIALLLLSPVVFKLTRDYFLKEKSNSKASNVNAFK